MFLFDEPLSNLDAKMRVQMRAEITRLHRRLASTMIYVTHDQVEAMTMGDRICLMKDGRIQQVAPPLEIYHNPANMFVASFIGSPAHEFLRGHDPAGKRNAGFCRSRRKRKMPPACACKLPRPTRPIWARRSTSRFFLGLRPENFSVEPDGLGPSQNVSATVETLERMGAETYLYLHTSRHPFIVRTGAPVQAQPGSQLDLSANMEKAQYFEAADRKPFLKPGRRSRYGKISRRPARASCDPEVGPPREKEKWAL